MKHYQIHDIEVFMRLIAFLFILVFPVSACAEAPILHEDIRIETQDGKVHVFKVELALTKDQIMQGLMFRQDMPEMGGMLFYFGSDAPRSFWMKNTPLPLDIIFISAEGSIVNIHDNAVPFSEASIPSQGPARAVLEIHGGLSEKLNIKAGDQVFSRFFTNTLAEQ